ncbi:hypothetical protein Ancab_004702, partial [Ancistrocladus abbreviatus]
ILSLYARDKVPANLIPSLRVPASVASVDSLRLILIAEILVHAPLRGTSEASPSFLISSPEHPSISTVLDADIPESYVGAPDEEAIIPLEEDEIPSPAILLSNQPSVEGEGESLKRV